MIARAATAALALVAASAVAQTAKPAAPAATSSKHDSNAPINVEADRIEVQDREHKATWIGDVHVVQAEMTLTSDRATMLYSGSVANSGGADPAASGAGGTSIKVQRLDANGNVVVTRPGEVAKGDYGIYDLDRKLITLIGNVSLDRNGSVVHGGRLVIDQNTNRATVDGSAVGGQGRAGKGGRVSGRFLVNQSKSGSTS